MKIPEFDDYSTRLSSQMRIQQLRMLKTNPILEDCNEPYNLEFSN